MLHDLSHSQVPLPGFQIYPLSHTILLSKSSIHSHMHLSSFHISLLLQTAEINLHYTFMPYYFICLVSLTLDIKLNTLTLTFLTMSGMHNLAYESLILLQLPLHLFTLLTFICFTFLIVH